MSNGNVKGIDNAKDWRGKHSDVLMLQRKITHFLLTTTAKTRHAYDVWSFLREQANGEYNATINNIARDLHMSAKTVTAAQESLVGLGLLKIEEDAELTGQQRLITQSGISVHNNKAQYTVFATSDKIMALLSNSAEVAASPAAVVEEVPKVQEIQAEAVKVVASPAAVSPSRDELIKAREDEIQAIGRTYGLTSKAQLTELVAAVKAFANEVGRKAADAEIRVMANYIDAGVNADTRRAWGDYIKRQALHK